MSITILIKILIVITSYLFGSIPVAYVLFKIKKGDDIRKYGSGNVGGTNVIRTLGAGWGLFTIFADALKGFLPVLAVYLIYPGDFILLALVSVAVILGHVFPIYIRFKGGKAISTTLGVVLGISVLPFILKPAWLRILPLFIGLGIWIIIFIIIRIVSLGSLIAAVSVPVSFYLLKYPLAIVIAAVFWALLIFITHRDNIKRLVRGEEKKIKGKGA
ncbi:MAG: glycerol-3-phosphate 1-O-acyltransferase PlsY [Actinobacteria bacterium]|nr:glycerol-3-phosphate 1-O-acyltransferase PlsY [Actinomycetota bacterium]